MIFDDGNGSLPCNANLSLSYYCDISSPAVTTSSIEPSVSSTISMTSTDVISTPFPRPINCSSKGIRPKTQPGYNVTVFFYCYEETVNGK